MDATKSKPLLSQTKNLSMLAERKATLSRGLQFSFFKHLWEKAKSAWNYTVEVATNFVNNTVKKLIPCITYIEAVCNVDFDYERPDFYLLFEFEIEIAWFGFSRKIHMKMEHGKDATITANKASEKTLEEMIERAKTESYSLEKATEKVEP